MVLEGFFSPPNGLLDRTSSVLLIMGDSMASRPIRRPTGVEPLNEITRGIGCWTKTGCFAAGQATKNDGLSYGGFYFFRLRKRQRASRPQIPVVTYCSICTRTM